MTADPLNLAALREVAEAATPGPWEAVPRQAGIVCGECWDEPNHWVAGVAPEGHHSPDTWLTGVRGHDESAARADSAHIATFDPPTVLALLGLAERATAAEAAVERVRAECDYAEDHGHLDECGDAWVEVAVIRAALDPAPASEVRDEQEVERRVEWRVESETTEDEFGTDERRAREWLALCDANEGWEPAQLMRREVTVISTPWVRDDEGGA